MHLHAAWLLTGICCLGPIRPRFGDVGCRMTVSLLAGPARTINTITLTANNNKIELRYLVSVAAALSSCWPNYPYCRQVDSSNNIRRSYLCTVRTSVIWLDNAICAHDPSPLPSLRAGCYSVHGSYFTYFYCKGRQPVGTLLYVPCWRCGWKLLRKAAAPFLPLCAGHRWYCTWLLRSIILF